MNWWAALALYVFIGLPLLIWVGKRLQRISARHELPPEPSIFDNTIPPGSSPLTAETVRRAAQRLREEPPLWGNGSDDPSRD